MKFPRALAVLVAVMIFLAAALSVHPMRGAAVTSTSEIPAITIDYPEDESIFPPEITPPTFLWHDGEKAATTWRIDVLFADGAPGIRATVRGERMRIGPIDPRCIADSNERPWLTPRQATARTWTPDASAWDSIKKHSVVGPATVTISGFNGEKPDQMVSRGHIRIRTSRDPVGAPIFYRDVPLMPSKTEEGVIEPLSVFAVPLVAWRIRNIAETRSRLVMDDMPMCANCHSFSADGKTLGMDMDGLSNNRGMYILAPVKPEMSIRSEDLIQWRTADRELRGNVRVGFMSQVSPEGKYVVTTINDAALNGTESSPSSGPRNIPSNYYVANFENYRFLQVFYPTRGILCWYSRETGILQPLHGADDPRFVQMGAVWSPDGKYLVFARAGAKEPNPQGVPTATFATDPNELQIKYDLYRIPFNGGKGGTPEPIVGASRNGMSNSFPRVSPDGRWIVFVESRNGMLMRPDSQLYIVSATGGTARRMRCNTALMNSWHSFSPNGRWLVFSSKSRSPYTQMYLSHIDPEGNDSPAILVDNTTASNRAVNIPEFVNIPPAGLQKIGGPALEFYRLFDRAAYLQKAGRLEESIAEYRKALELNQNESLAHNNLSMLLLLTGRPQDAAAEFRKAKEINLRKAVEIEPAHAPSHNDLGMILLRTGRVDETMTEFGKAAELMPDFAQARCNLGGALAVNGKLDEAIVQLNKAMELDSGYAPTHYNLGLVFSMRGAMQKAIAEWQRALEIDPKYAEPRDRIANALYSQGRIPEALAHWRQGILLRPNDLPALQRTAWILATCPEPSVRNGREALALARRAVQLTNGKDPAILDTLAAAYAETGSFGDAALTARTALALAAQNNDPALAAALKDRIALYEARRPFRAAPVHP